MAVASAGFYDGVHLGHRQVLKTLVETARQRSERSVVVTFWPHPGVFLGKQAADLMILTPLDRKIEMIKALGVDEVYVLEFNQQLSQMSAEEFIRDILKGRFGVDTLVLGYDSTLGHDRLDTAGIGRVAASMGIDTLVAAPVENGDRAISSTRIRKLLGDGRISEANELLGYDYY